MKRFYFLLLFSVFAVFTAFSQQTDTQTKISKAKKAECTKAPVSSSNLKNSEVTMPDDFPQFIDTGNPEQDNATFAEAKRRWIEANPEKYKALNPKMEVTPEELLEKQRKDQNK